jgi:hypothetical protein
MMAEEMKNGAIYLEGNSKVLKEYFQRLLKKKDIQIAFFGDHYITDV